MAMGTTIERASRKVPVLHGDVRVALEIKAAYCGPRGAIGAIARALGRAKATISRELQRNALPSGG